MDRSEIIGEALAKQRNDISVFIGAARKYGASLGGLALQYRNYIESNGLGASEVPEGQVRTDAGELIAVISYNGRVWAV